MRYFVTSDLHLGHNNIIGYCNRPFKDGDAMNETIIQRYNERVKPEDTWFILGDLCFRAAGGVKSGSWLEKLNGIKIPIRGNHDNNNSTKTIIDVMLVKFANMHIGMLHDPADIHEVYNGESMYSPLCRGANFVLCGHVHGLWKHRWFDNGSAKLAINVGVDVWNFYPKTLDEIVEYYYSVRKERA